MILLDTCVVSELLRPQPDSCVLRWIREQEEHRLLLSVLTAGEIAKGIAKHADARRRARLQSWLDSELLPRFAGRILDVTLLVTLRWGRIVGDAASAGRSLPVLDSLIAATALEARATVATRNVDDFAPTGVPVINPWDLDVPNEGADLDPIKIGVDAKRKIR